MLCTHQALNSLYAVLHLHLTLHNTAFPLFRILQITVYLSVVRQHHSGLGRLDSSE
jgi:hypothetical protein